MKNASGASGAKAQDTRTQTVKPKRIARDYRGHPIYEYRGFYIVRGFAVLATPGTKYFSVYRRFSAPNGVSEWADWNDCNRLKDAVSQIDLYLDGSWHAMAREIQRK